MKLHIITIGRPKLDYAKLGWDEYYNRLARYHQVSAVALADKYASDASKILAAASDSFVVALAIDGQQFSSLGLAEFLQRRELAAQEVSFIIGGPDGLPLEVIQQANFRWSLGELTLPHDLAMVNLLEALYRASAISAGHPYHR